MFSIALSVGSRRVIVFCAAFLCCCASMSWAPAGHAQNPPSLILRPRVVPPPVAEVQPACPECQAQADEYNRSARRLNYLNFQLAHRRREIDLQQQAIALVEAEIADLQSSAASPTRDARLGSARQRLDAYRAQLAHEQALAQELERLVAEATSALAAARAALQACEDSCIRSTGNEVAQAGAESSSTGEVQSPGQGQAGAQGQPAEGSSPASPQPGRYSRWRTQEEIRRDRIEQEKLDATLKAMTGDEWGAELAAFFTSTLFDTSTPFETAYGRNLQTLRDINYPTPEEIAAAADLERQNARVNAKRAQSQQATLKATGRNLQHQYSSEARRLIGPGYTDLANAGDATTAALMAQDAHMGQLLQFRANLNLIRIGDGSVPEGSFVNLSGTESFTRLTQINQELGFLRANDGDADRIAALEAERAQLLTIPGLAPSKGLIEARTGLITGLTGLSQDVYNSYWAYLQLKEESRVLEFGADGTPVTTNFQGTQQEYPTLLAELENKYLSTLGQSPFLGAMVDPFATGDPVPLWQYLLDTGNRTPRADQTALTQAIDFLDTASAQAIDQFGTIVTTVSLLDTYGSPVFAPLRQQVVADLAPFYPPISANMDLLTSQYQANFEASALSRTTTDVVIGFVQITVAGVIVVLPVTAPVLVPVEIALTGGQVGLEGFRTYYAWQDMQRANQAAAVGSGASLVGAQRYEDLFNTQLGTFVLVAGMAPVSVAGSMTSLDVARTQVRIAEFRAMRPDEQVAAVRDLPLEARAQLVSQLDRTGKTLFAFAWEKDVLDAKLIASVRTDPFWREMIDGVWQPLTPQTRNASDAEILERLQHFAPTRDKIIMDPAATRQFYDEGVGGEVSGTFSPFELPDGEFPKAGMFSSQMTQAEIDALFATPANLLTPEQIALKADLLLQGHGRPVLYVNPVESLDEARMTLAEIEALFAKSDPTPQELALREDLIARGWGRKNVKGDKAGWNTPPPAPPPNPFNPFAPFGPAGDIDSRVGTLRGVDDPGMSGSTIEIPGRPRNPNRTALFDDPDLPPDELLDDTVIYESFVPPAIGLFELPVDLNRLLHGDELPIGLWRTGPPNSLLIRQPRPPAQVPVDGADLAPAGATAGLLDETPAGPSGAVNTPDASTNAPVGQVASDPVVGTIVHVAPDEAPVELLNKTPAWVPFVTKAFPIGCRFIVGAQDPECDKATYLYALEYPYSASRQVADALRTTPGIVHVEADERRLVQAGDPYMQSRGSWGQSYEDQWALHKIGLDAVKPTTGAAPVTVAVIDTGVAWNHDDLAAGDLWVNPGEIPANHIDDDANGYVDDIVGWNFVQRNNLPWDFNGHGTAVAGIIAATRDNGIGIAGVNDSARIMVLKAMDDRGRGQASSIAEAIVYAVRNGARVINLSVGGRRLTRTEQLAIEYAWKQGVVVVVAAGNEAIDLRDYGPGGVGRAITVSATDPSDKRLQATNSGAVIDIAAPGLDVLAPRAIGTDLHTASRVRDYKHGANVVGADAGYIRATGTSFAAPLVSGAASLLLANRPSLRAEQVERMLLQSALDIEAPGIDRLTGYGRLDVAAALGADPNFFIEAAIHGVEVAQTDRGAVARVTGTADADRFAHARIEIGKGEEPSSWTDVGVSSSQPVHAGVVGDVPARAFQGSAVWTLRLVTTHANGRTREARFLLRLK